MRTAFIRVSTDGLQSSRRKKEQPSAEEEKLPNVQRINPTEDLFEPVSGPAEEAADPEDLERPRSWWKKEN